MILGIRHRRESRFADLVSSAKVVVLAPLILPHEKAAGLLRKIRIVLDRYKGKLLLAMPPRPEAARDDELKHRRSLEGIG